MVTYEQVIDGMAKFIDSEIINQLSGNSKVFIGIGSGIALKKGKALYDNLKNNEVIKMLELIDEHGHIDLDTIYHEAKKHAEKEPIKIDLAMIGTLKLDEDDIEKLYVYIKNS